jgi:hypothetical protein
MTKARPRVERTRRATRVLASPSRVYVAPDAKSALEGRWGVLQGMKRPLWVEVLDFSPCSRPRLADVALLRFGQDAVWPIVGLSLPEVDWSRRAESLLRELVPGDVVMTEKGARVHLGDVWADTRVLRDPFLAR